MPHKEQEDWSVPEAEIVRLVRDADRLEELLRDAADADLERWWRLFAFFLDNDQVAAASYERRSAIVYIAAVLKNAREMAEINRTHREQG